MINVIGGILIGYFQKDFPITQALQTYTMLSIGDGLVTQVPAIIVSIAAGILVTRSSEESNLGEFVGRQLTIYPRAVAICGFMLLGFAIFLTASFWPFFILSMACFVTAYLLAKREKEEPELEEIAGSAPVATPSSATGAAPATATDPVEAAKDGDSMIIEEEVFALEVGYGLLILADRKKGGDLLDRITGARKNFTKEMGMLLPTIAVRDNIELEANEYRFLLRGKEVARSKVIPDRYLAMNVAGGDKKLEGIEMGEPVFGFPATWISEEDKRDAEIAGFTVVDASSVLVTHLSDSMREVAHLILEREGVQKLIDLIKDKNPTLVSELLPDLVSVGVIQRVLQNLLREKISIKSLTLILETIADVAPITKSPDDLSEHARRRLGIYFVKEYESEPAQLTALTLEPRLEQILISRVRKSQFDIGLMMDPSLTEGILNEIVPRLKEMADKGLPQVLVTSSDLRLAFRRFMEPSYPKLAVLAFHELPNETQVNNFAAIPLPSSALPEDLGQAPIQDISETVDEGAVPVAA